MKRPVIKIAHHKLERVLSNTSQNPAIK